ncbi:hypothetical protein KOW79_014209 [Hemibagrus wyckioides]|uniref:IRS-type PTB domain-containing protein n=3 Tax=Hemibagrus wyckioides TaxID=337641 RepID=A0A9D3SKI3_9TELE|nr:hypothetical protein KOW79_014209 [Hemibagrus wyckioides]
MEGDVRKKGMLYHQQQRFGKKWKKVWAEAIADSTHSISCLELFEFSKSSMKESKKRAEGKKVIVMRDCVKIKEQEVEGCPKQCSTFLLETTDKTHIFASPTMELHSWIMELCRLAFPLNQSECRSQKQDHQQAADMQENTLYDTTESVRDFLVMAVATEAALRCKLYGEYILTPQSDSLLLKDYKTKKVLLTWPYRFVRKFGQDTMTFNFEAGRRCESGEGYFEFATSHSEQLFEFISGALKKFQKGEASGTRPKEQQIPHYSEQSHTPPAKVKHPKKKLTTSVSLNSINVSDSSKKDNIGRTPLPCNVQDPVYAMINKSKSHSKSKNSKTQQFCPLPDIDDFSEDIFGVLGDEEEEGNQKNPEQLAIHPKFKDYKSEPVYSEVKVHGDYGSKDEAVDDIPHSLTSDLQDSRAVAFLKVSDDIPCMVDEEEQLERSMEQLSIHQMPNVYGAESIYSQVPGCYDDYGDNEECVDIVEIPEYFYPPPPPCAFDIDPSFEDPQDEGFCTYDNLPKRL